MKKEKIFSLIILAIIILDQLTKFLITKNMTLSQSIPLIQNILHLTYIHNTGATFGMLKGMNLLLIWVSVIVIGGILYNYNKIPKDKIPQLSLALIIGGAIGNLIDRISLGKVVDFIDFRVWPAFNIADSAISIGAVLLIIYFWNK